VTDKLLHNSRALGLFDEILHSSHATMRLVELLGRGISAEARCHMVFPPENKRPHSDPPELVYLRASALADRVEQLCAAEDDLAEAWRRQIEHPNEADFEASLRDVVLRLERWAERFADDT
jgi:hypothetical protein